MDSFPFLSRDVELLLSISEIRVSAQECTERRVHLVSDGYVFLQEQLVPEYFIPNPQCAQVEVGRYIQGRHVGFV